MSKSNVLTRLTSIFTTRKTTKSSLKFPKPTSSPPDPNTLKPTSSVPIPNSTKTRNPKPKPIKLPTLPDAVQPRLSKKTPNKLIIPTTLPDPFTQKTLTEKIKDLLSEKNPEILLEKFKYLSNFSYFREKCSGIYKLTIHRLAIAKQYPLIQQALESQKCFLSKEFLAARIIYLYGKYGMFDHAYKVFDELPERNCKRGTNALNALLGAALNSEKYDKVYEMFNVLPEKLSITVNADSYNTVMSALCKTGEVEKAVLMINEMEECGLKPSVISFNTVLSVFYEAGECEKGDSVWDKMVSSNVVPDIMCYNFKLRGLVKNGKVVEAVQLANELGSKRLKANVSTYNVVIQGLINEDDCDGVKEWYGKLMKNGCVPNKITFCTLVPFLCDKGDYELAFEFCEYMLTRRRNCLIDEGVLQNVVDGLAENTMVDKAGILVQLGLSNGYATYHLIIPGGV